MGTIYILRNKMNEMSYVGQTTQNFKTRYRAHQMSHSYVGNALRKYGVANFDKLLLENVPNEELDYWEIHYIQECNSMSPNGYNLTSGGKRPIVIKEEVGDRISKSRIGHPTSEETKRKIGDGNRGKIRSEEFKKHVGELSKGNRYRIGFPSPMKGKHHTEETLEKLRSYRKGYIPWNKGIKCPNISATKTGKHYPKLSEAKMGHFVSEETKRKMRKPHKNRVNIWLLMEIKHQ